MSEVHALLSEYGFHFPRRGLARSAPDAVRLAKEIGFPVVLKAVSPQIVHKTEVGGVRLNLTTAAEVHQAYTEIIRSVSKGAPEATLEGVQVEAMCRGGVELFIGLQHNPQLGPTIAVGLGGILTELLEDVAFRLLPITEGDAQSMLTEIKGKAILEGYRGQPPVPRALLVELLMAAGRLGMEHARRLEAVDLNPVLLRGAEHWVLDAKVLWSEEPEPVGDETPNTLHLEGFFTARSVAVVGASATPGKIGHAILNCLTHHEGHPKVYPINPQHSEVLGMEAFPSLMDVPDPVDLVVVVVPLRNVPSLIDACEAKGIHNMVIVSGGGKEVGDEGMRLEEDIRQRAARAGLRIIGPNCIGVYNAANRLETFFQPHDKMDRPSAGRVAILTQSGTMGAALLEAFAQLGISKFVSYGNRLDVDEADLIAYLGDDPSTDVIVCYFEGIRNGRKLCEAVRDVSPHKPVIVFKSGRTPQGGRASVSHTGFFGGRYAPWKGALTQVGALPVDGLEELVASAKALIMQSPARGNRVGMLSNGAGPMVQAMDLLTDVGLELNALSSAAVQRLQGSFPPYFIVQNPLDLTGSATAGDYEVGIRALLSDPEIDMVLPWFVFQDAPLDADIADVLDVLSSEFPKPILCGAIGGRWTNELSQRIEGVGVPVFHTVRAWLAAATALAHRSRSGSL